MKKIITCEKPSVAATYARVLGLSNCRYDGYYEDNEWIITWCVGHLITMSYPEKYDDALKVWKMEDLPFLPSNYLYEVISDVKDQFNVIRHLYNRPDIGMIYYAGDAGREGIYIQALVDRMAGHNPNAVVKVVWISSQTDSEILRGIREAKDVSAFSNMISSAYMRAIEDYAVGINLSRALTLRFQDAFHLKGSVSVGRVMTCVLGMIVNRELEINNFKPTDYYKIHSRINLNGEFLEAEWRTETVTPQMYNNTGFLRKEDAAAFRQSLPPQLVIENIEIKQEKKNAPLLYNLAELQSACSKALHISPDKTLESAQRLYEAKLTTYPRTDARVLSSAIASEISNNIRGLGQISPNMQGLVDNILASNPERIADTKYTDDSKITDHYAIIPTGECLYVLQTLNEQDKAVFKLIVARFLAIFMPPAIYKKVKLTENANGQRFYATGSTLIEPGYMAITGVPKSNTSLPAAVESLKNGDVFPAQYGIIGAQTSPPSRYTTGSIVLAMENAGQLIEDEELRAQIKGSGIGTSATRAEILKKLQAGYFIKVNPKTQIIQPDAKGYINYKIVKNLIPEMLNPELTANWEKNLTNIQDGLLTKDNYEQHLNQYIIQKVNEIKTVPISQDLSNFVAAQKANMKDSKPKKKVQTYLNVPYEDKDLVKSLGAYFDMDKKTWYVPEGKDVTPFAKWDAHAKTVKTIYLDVPFADKDELKALGGAKWDKDKKKWYISSLHPNKKAFEKWIKKN